MNEILFGAIMLILCTYLSTCLPSYLYLESYFCRYLYIASGVLQKNSVRL